MTQRYERHGLDGTRIYRIWRGMLRRCYDPNNPAYPQYGARGIIVCERWKQSLRAFYDDMGEPPPAHSIDRFPNKLGNYEPNNCRWATSAQQARNTRTNNLITYKGETLSIAEWAERLGIYPNTLHQRWARGLTPEQILDPEPRHKYKGGWVNGVRLPRKVRRPGFRARRQQEIR